MSRTPAPPVIDLRGAARSHPGPPPVQALRPTDLTVGRGEYLALVGPSGSGKSTLFNLLGLLDRPSAGGYLLDGIFTGAMSEAERSAMRGHRIGLLPQTIHLLPHHTAAENVALAQVYTGPGRGDRREAARQALRGVGLGHRLDALPSALSGGERRRVAIARALVNRPGLLLCDEPTDDLDAAASALVLDLLDEANATGATVLVVTHDPATAARARRTVTIRAGTLTEGRTDDASTAA